MTATNGVSDATAERSSRSPFETSLSSATYSKRPSEVLVVSA